MTVDEPQTRTALPPIVAVTSPQLAVVRFHGRRTETWEARNIPVDECFRYLYDADELGEWVPRIRQAAAEVVRDLGSDLFMIHLLAHRGAPCEDRSAALEASVSRLGELSTTAQASALAELLAWTGRSGRGFVVDSFWSAWDAFARSGSYQETIQHAVGYGNDTDTSAAIAGGLAGIYWGTDEEAGGIPAEWLTALRDKELVEEMLGHLEQPTDQ